MSKVNQCGACPMLGNNKATTNKITITMMKKKPKE